MKKNLIWNTCGSVFYSACQWLITIIVVYVSDYTEAGFLSLAMSMSSSFSAISLFSMRNFQVSDVKCEFKTSQYVSSRIWTSMLALVLCCVVSGVTQSLYQALCIDAFMLVRVSEAITDVMHGANQKHERYDYIGISYIIRGVITIVGFTIIMMMSDNMVVTLFVVAVLNMLVSIFFDCFMSRKIENYKINLFDRNILILVKKCIPLVLFSFFLSLETLISRNILQNVCGTEALGIYSSIASPAVVVQLLASVIFNPFIPKLSDVFIDNKFEEFKKLLHRIYFFILILIVVVVVTAALFGKFGLWILFGESILDSYELFMPVIFVTLCTGIIWILSAIMTLLRRIKPLLVYTIISFVICAALVYPCVIYFGANGASVVQLISMPVMIILVIVDMEFFVNRCKKEVNKRD